ncbi:MAG: hypothetical protein BGP04_11480 [Rhizobiales bacterium 62-17]|nr:MAG: hypothetical protein BGP04_11480 [Rhizobiales bacterium 62-17]
MSAFNKTIVKRFVSLPHKHMGEGDVVLDRTAVALQPCTQQNHSKLRMTKSGNIPALNKTIAIELVSFLMRLVAAARRTTHG